MLLQSYHFYKKHKHTHTLSREIQLRPAYFATFNVSKLVRQRSIETLFSSSANVYGKGFSLGLKYMSRKDKENCIEYVNYICMCSFT